MKPQGSGRKAKTQRAKTRLLAFAVLICALAAGNILAQSDLAALAAQIERGDSEQKRSALLQIRNLQTPEAARLAVSALRDKAEIVRASAAQSVVYLPPAEAVRALLPLLTDKKPFVRREAAYALGAIGDSTAVGSLIETIRKDKAQEVRDAATAALGAIGDVSAVTALTEILRRRPKAKEEFMRRAAARSIGQIAQIKQIGIRRVQTPRTAPIAQLAVAGFSQYLNLSEINPTFRQAVGVLIGSLQAKNEFPDVRREAAFALGAIGDSAAIPVLQANSNAEDYYLARICRESLAVINNC